MKISGNPSAVNSAILKLIFNNGDASNKVFHFEPDGIMFENFEETVARLQVILSQEGRK